MSSTDLIINTTVRINLIFKYEKLLIAIESSGEKTFTLLKVHNRSGCYQETHLPYPP